MPRGRKSAESEVILRWSGDLTVAVIGKMAEEIRAALNRSKRIGIDLSGATEIDAAFLQLCCAAHRSAVSSGRELTLSSPLPPELANLLSLAGMKSLSGCSGVEKNRCLWLTPALECND